MGLSAAHVNAARFVRPGLIHDETNSVICEESPSPIQTAKYNVVFAPYRC
jgi:hypothetical protein